MTTRARWYWDRLLAMSLAELRGRGEVALHKQAWRHRQAWQAPTPEPLPVDPWHLPAGLQAEPELLAEAARYHAGDYSWLNLTFHEDPLDWHRDPQTGRRTPLSFGPDLDYRDPALAGNVKNTWEKNRHHHLTLLALAYALSRDEGHAREVDRQLRDWLAANPFPRGVNWTSMLELGVRLIAWVWIERLLRGSAVHAGLFGPQGVLWDAIYWHQWLIAHLPSQGSSANNHLVGEAAGAYMAAACWPCFPASAGWRTHAREILEREIALQTFESGLNREQAAAYHLFSLELFLLPALEGERLGEPFSAAYKQHLAAMLLALPRLADVQGNLPRYGDDDGGTAVQLRPLGGSRLAGLYRLGRAFLGAALPLPADGATMAALLWPEAPDRAPAHQPPGGSEAFEDAGVYILAARRGTPAELLCTADAGPLGFLSIAGHGHADALSFTLSVGGQPVLVDPGTYVYHAAPVWRAYFRSTRAHNTVLVDGQDQTVAHGPFLWSRQQAQARALGWEPTPTGARLVAEHDGYRRLAAPVQHRRTLELADTTLTVTDLLDGAGWHALEWRLHLAPRCEATLRNGRCHLTWPGGTLGIDLDPRLEWRLARGEAQAGWYSAAFNVIEPTYTLIGLAKLELPATLKHVVRVGELTNQ